MPLYVVCILERATFAVKKKGDTVKRVVVTGATGAIGRSLIKVCIKAGYEVLAIVHRGSQRALELECMEHCHVLRLDLSEYNKALDEMNSQGIETCDYELFFHLAWMAPFGKDRDNLALQLDNVKFSLLTVRLAKDLGCLAFVGTGSQAEYGRVEGILSEDTPAFPETGYGIAKLCSGQLTRLSCEQMGIKHIWCRVLSVYGPYDRDQTLISYATVKMMNNEETEFSPCEQMWDYIYSDDAAEAILLAGQKGVNGKVYIIGSGEVHPLKEYVGRIAEITRYTKDIGFGKRSYNDRQVMYLQADSSSLKSLGFSNKVSFDEGIQYYIDWKNEREMRT